MGKDKTPIPIKNLFYMLCYAWNVLAIQNDIKVGSDDFDDAYNLLGRIYSYGLGKLIRLGFHRSYIEKTEELPTVRGKIEIQQTVGSSAIQKKHLVCSYDEYSKDDVFNRILKYTAVALIKNPAISIATKKALKKQLVYFSDVGETAPTPQVRRGLIFNRNNMTYKMLINVAVMLYDNTIVNDEDGANVFKDFFRDGQMEKVYEMFILNFYAINLDQKQYHVHAPKITWVMEENAEERFGDLVDVVDNPADRRTDIVIENRVTNKQLILDAKYYTETLVHGYYDSTIERYRTRHIEQVRGYVTDSQFEGKKIGALVYPTVKDDFPRPRLAPLQDAMVVFKTLNLNQEWRLIEADMLRFVAVLEQLVDR